MDELCRQQQLWLLEWAASLTLKTYRLGSMSEKSRQ